VLAEDRGDYDNLTKTIDALKGVVWADDARVCVGFTTRCVAGPGERPRAVLTIWALGPAAPLP
jgi:Holliday junction resolvase RusA-like endonuclease